MTRDVDWVLLAYRLPRLPSTPRSTVWRKLKRLGVAQLTDGLVALPFDPRNREQLEWIAEEVTDYGGDATVWIGRPADTGAGAILIHRMTAAAAAEYAAVASQAVAARRQDEVTRRRAVLRLRRELHRIQSRDYFSPTERDAATRAVEELAVLEPASAGR
jgi:Protein ChrB, N-terminal